MQDLPSPIPSAHPNAGLTDVDLSPTERMAILQAPWKPAEKVPKAKDLIEVCGDPSGGDPKATKAVRAWEALHLMVLKDLPGAWNKSESPRLYVHKVMAPYFVEALIRLEKAGLIHELETIGCFNFRHIRYSKDPEADLSRHAWAMAVDINATKNFAVYNRKTYQSTRHLPVGPPWSKSWRAIWPQGLSEEIVTAFESVGFRWGGRWKSFVDPMHFELVA